MNDQPKDFPPRLSLYVEAGDMERFIEAGERGFDACLGFAEEEEKNFVNYLSNEEHQSILSEAADIVFKRDKRISELEQKVKDLEAMFAEVEAVTWECAALDYEHETGKTKTWFGEYCERRAARSRVAQSTKTKEEK